MRFLPALNSRDSSHALLRVRAGQPRDEPALLPVLDGRRVIGFGVVVVGEQRPAAGRQLPVPVDASYTGTAFAALTS